MSQPLCIIADLSGSMLESGKQMALCVVVRFAEQYLRLGYGHADLKLVAWNKTARFVDWNPEKEVPKELLDCGAPVGGEEIDALLGEQPTGRILVVTDGFWSRDDTKILNGWRKKKQGALRIIKVGADADPYLKGEDVFIAENMIAAFDGWLEEGLA